ncbi:MAG: DMT family transporter [Planctomycetes bacterium]|nr:DMT family transporter [Planctomycetota bacterium]
MLPQVTVPFAGAGEIAAVTSAFAWSFGSVFYALAFKTLSPVQVAWFKNAIAGSILGIISILFIGGTVQLDSLSWLALSGLLGLGVGDWLYFLAIAHIGIGRTVIINQSVPALTALLAWPLFGEMLSSNQILGIVLIIGGGVLAESRRFTSNEKSSHFDNIGLLAAIGCAILWTVSNLAVSKGMTGVSPITGGSIRLAAGSLFFVAWFIKDKTLISNFNFLFRLNTWKLLAFPTLFGACFGMFLNVSAFKWTTPGVAASLASTVPLFAIPLSAWLLHEKPGKRGWTGAIIVVLGALLVGGLLA